MSTDRHAGATTKVRLLAAATRLFATQGYRRVTTRALAAEARVNVAAIAYHFGGKKGLYRAVFDALLAETDPLLHHVTDELTRRVARANGDRDALAAVVSWLIARLLAAFVDKGALQGRLGLMLRQFSEPDEMFDRIYAARIAPLQDALCALVAACRDQPRDAPETRLAAQALMGQCAVFGFAQVVTFRRLGWDGYDPQRVALLHGVLRDWSCRALGLPEGERA